MTDENEQVGYQVLVCNIKWNKSSKNIAKKFKNIELPDQMSFDIPDSVLAQANKAKNSFNDIIESFIYNVLYRKFGHEVNTCQIWLPFE